MRCEIRVYITAPYNMTYHMTYMTYHMTYTDDVTFAVFVVLQPIYMNDVVLLFQFLFRKRKFLGPLIRSYGEVLLLHQGIAVAQWLRCCATNRKFAGSFPDGVIGIFY